MLGDGRDAEERDDDDDDDDAGDKAALSIPLPSRPDPRYPPITARLTGSRGRCYHVTSAGDVSATGVSRVSEMMAGDELASRLNRRLRMGDPEDGEREAPSRRVFNPYTEFKEFSRKQIKDMEAMFRHYDAGKDGFIDLMELKLMMEKLGAPQTHLGLKDMIKEVDEDFDGKLSFREFLLIFRKAAAGELEEDSGLHALARLSEIDVSIEGVKGAKNFFEAKVQAINHGSRFEQEIKAEQEEKKKQAEEKEQRKAAFKELQSTFKP